MPTNKPTGRLPDFLVIGAAKSGTTSLDFYLSLHPEIFMSTPKEPRFFAGAPEPLGRWHRGLHWYRSLFDTQKRICGETSPTYAAAPSIPGVPARIAAVLPQAKLIYLVRSPYERLVSYFLMYRRTSKTDREFAEFLDDQNPVQGKIFEISSQLCAILGGIQHMRDLLDQRQLGARGAVEGGANLAAELAVGDPAAAINRIRPKRAEAPQWKTNRPIGLPPLLMTCLSQQRGLLWHS